MRITNNMLVNNMINNIGNNMTRLDKYQNQLATGKKIQVPSDDPVVAARALKLRTDVAQLDQYTSNAKDAQSWLDTTESALSDVGDVIQRARELAVQAANSPNTPSDMQKIEEEVKQLKNQLVHLSNTTYAGRYIFSGYQTNHKLVDDDETSPNFGKFAIGVNTDMENIKYEIGIGDDININVAGGDLFNNGGNAVINNPGVLGTGTAPTFPLTISSANNTLAMTLDGIGVTASIQPGTYSNMTGLASAVQDAINLTPNLNPVSVTPVGGQLQIISGKVPATLPVVTGSIGGTAASVLGLDSFSNVTDSQTGSLIQDFDTFIADLQAGDNKGCSSMVDRLDNAMNNVLRIRADVGARQNRIDLSINRLGSSNTNFTKLMSDNEDADMAETIMNLQNEENVYRASLSGGARIIQPTLVDFLR